MNPLQTYAEIEQFYRSASAAGYRLRLEKRSPKGWCWSWLTPNRVVIHGYTDADTKAAALVFAAMDPNLSAY